MICIKKSRVDVKLDVTEVNLQCEENLLKPVVFLMIRLVYLRRSYNIKIITKPVSSDLLLFLGCCCYELFVLGMLHTDLKKIPLLKTINRFLIVKCGHWSEARSCVSCLPFTSFLMRGCDGINLMV